MGLVVDSNSICDKIKWKIMQNGISFISANNSLFSSCVFMVDVDYRTFYGIQFNKLFTL